MLPSKICSFCGRSFDWRKKWKENWDEVKFCSKKCQSHSNKSRNLSIEESVLALLNNQWIQVADLAKHPQLQHYDLFEVSAALRRLGHKQAIRVKTEENTNSIADLRNRTKVMKL